MTSHRIVLDTNVCLDLFVFDDPRCVRLRDALHAGDVIAVTDDACREDWVRVLQYPELRLDEAMRERATARFDDAIRHRSSLLTHEADLPLLPRCRDPDDQKFLELAARVQARWLLTRDDHLLVLAKRASRDGVVAILRPSEWCSMQPQEGLSLMSGCPSTSACDLRSGRAGLAFPEVKPTVPKPQPAVLPERSASARSRRTRSEAKSKSKSKGLIWP